MVGLEVHVSEAECRTALRRVQQSDAFKGARALRHLLEFLAEKSLAGEADQLKEYSIGVDACGKSADYDPREDSTVRIQAGRLRQKLADYYKSEGKDDTVVIDLPKGGFRIDFIGRPVVAAWPDTAMETTEEVPAPASVPPINSIEPQVTQDNPARKWKATTGVLAACLVVALGWAGWNTLEMRREAAGHAALEHTWTPQMEALWGPLLLPARPLVLAVSTPLFVGIEGSGYYRTVGTTRWEEATQDAGLKAVQKALHDPQISPRHPFTAVADANAVFLLEKILALRKPNTVFSRNIDLTWRQLSDNNVLLIGSARHSAELLGSLPTQMKMFLERDGLRLTDPQGGEQALYKDQAKVSQSASGTDDGEVYSLITHVAGPNGNGDVVAFVSNLNGGSLAAVEWFTNPDLAKVLVEKLRNAQGAMPRYYQVALKVKFRGGVPTDTTYLTHRELQLHAGAGR